MYMYVYVHVYIYIYIWIYTHIPPRAAPRVVLARGLSPLSRVAHARARVVLAMIMITITYNNTI